VSTAVRLPELAAEINKSHACVEQTFRDGVAHAIRAGELLIEAKASVPHGQWDKWLKANITFRPRTARVYMQIAALDPEKRQRVADLPLRKAINAIRNLEHLPPEERREELLRKYHAKAERPVERTVVRSEPPTPPAPIEPSEVADCLVGQLVEAAAFERVAVDHLREAFARRFGGAEPSERIRELERINIALQSENEELKERIAELEAAAPLFDDVSDNDNNSNQSEAAA
jgi:hypothetical protein